MVQKAVAVASGIVIFSHKAISGLEHEQKINLNKQGLNLKP